MKLGPYDLNTIVTGDARELAKAIPDESVDLIFTDPVYDRIEDYEWLAQTAARVLKPSGSVLAFCGAPDFPQICTIFIQYLDAAPPLITLQPGPSRIMRGWNVWNNAEIILWFGKGKTNTNFMPQQMSAPINGKRVHNWGKNELKIKQRLRYFEGAIVFDPFTGGGTVPAVCKMLGRNYLAFEIEPDTADKARQRVEMTQPPLFVMEPEQLELIS